MRRVFNMTLWILLAASLPALAQQSASFRSEEAVFNSGGSPADGSAPASASFRITQDALGEGIGGTTLAGNSFTLDGGFVAAYAPVGEVLELTFDSPAELTWASATSAVGYNGYRDSLAELPGLLYGQCRASGIPGNSWNDPDTPVPGDGYFYLVTGLSRLDEEGGKGAASDGTRRFGIQCP